MVIDKSIPIPAYYQLKKIIYDRIDKKIYVPGVTVLTENKLMAEFGLSRTTVRQALSELSSEQILERHKGIGTLIRPKKKDDTFKYNNEINYLIDGRSIVSTKLISFRVEKPDSLVAEILHLSLDDEIYIMDRLRLDQNGAFAYSHTYLPVKYFPNAKEDIENVTNSLYKYIDQNDYRITSIKQYFEIGHCDKNTAQILKGYPNSIVWIITNIAYSNSIPVEYSLTSILHQEGFRFELTANREEYPISPKLIA